MNNTLYLASHSMQRRNLLEQAEIPYQLIDQNADELACDWSQPLFALLETIALSKMKHAHLPLIKEGQEIFVLTADTMGQDQHGIIHGKPVDKDDAIKKIKALRGIGTVATAFCLERKLFINNTWITQQQCIKTVQARYEFNMPDSWIEQYLHEVPYYLSISGGVTIGGFGAQFVNVIQGSYSTIMGLPMFELRQALEKMSFYHE